LVRLYLEDSGFEQVRSLAASNLIASCIIGRAETAAALHRRYRKGIHTKSQHDAFQSEFRREFITGAFHWLPLSLLVLDRVQQVFSGLDPTCFLRAADAIHLACAAENGFAEIYSNDRHLLSAAQHFGLRGVNIISAG
jgi:predicted nucleic acid-binding protein